MVANTSPTETDGTECRRERRYTVAKAGRILTGLSNQGLTVEIEDISLSGARLRLRGGEQFKPAFRLLFVAERLVYPCRISWRRGDRAGVQFVGEPYRLRGDGQ